MARRRIQQSGSGFFNPYPRYLQIRNILARRLGEGYTPGDRFPTEREICSEFDVSRETVREALLGLEKDGFIVRRRGSGTVVARLPERPVDQRLTGLVEDITELKLNTDVDVVRAGSEKAPARVGAILRIPPGESSFRIQRLRRVDGKPFACHDAFLPLDLGSEVARLDLTHTTLFRELARTFDLELVEIFQHIEANAADPGTARLLEVDVGAPLLVIRRALDHAHKGVPTMLFETYFRADRYYYSVQIDRGVPKRSATARADESIAASTRRPISTRQK